LSNKYTKYLGIRHDYLKTNCISLIKLIYEKEKVNSLLEDVCSFLGFTEGKVTNSQTWSTELNMVALNDWLDKNTKKVSLTTMQEYDVIVFKSARSNFVKHLGMYIGNNKFIHLSENDYSKIDEYGHLWRMITLGVYRKIQ